MATEPTPAALQIQTRIAECLRRAARICCDENQPPVVRDVATAYLFTLCKQRVRFLRAALQYLCARGLELPETGRHSLAELIVHPPARWEFEHVDVFGTASDALCCAGRAALYSCSSTLSQGTHYKFRVGGNDDKKRARSGFGLASPRLPMTNCIHRQAKTIREAPLAQAQALTETSHVHGLRQRDLVSLALALHVGAGFGCSLGHLFKQFAHRFPPLVGKETLRHFGQSILLGLAQIALLRFGIHGDEEDGQILAALLAINDSAARRYTGFPPPFASSK